MVQPAGSQEPSEGILSLCQTESPEEWTLKPDEAHINVLQRGASLALREIVKDFDVHLPGHVPILWKMSVESFTERLPESDQDTIFCLQTLATVCSQMSPQFHPHLEACLPRLCHLVAHNLEAMRHMASKCLAKLATVIPSPVVMALVKMQALCFSQHLKVVVVLSHALMKTALQP